VICLHVGKKRDKYRFLIGRPERRRSLKRFRRRLDDYVNGSQGKRMEWLGQVAYCRVECTGTSAYRK
jgi:hypothetical protein